MANKNTRNIADIDAVNSMVLSFIGESGGEEIESPVKPGTSKLLDYLKAAGGQQAEEMPPVEVVPEKPANLETKKPAKFPFVSKRTLSAQPPS